MRRREPRGGGIVLLLLAFGCGSDPAAESAREPVASSENQPPVVLEIRLEPREPAAGERLRAIVRAHDPDADPVRLTFAWKISGWEQPETGPAIDLEDVRRGHIVSVEVTPHDGRSAGEPVEASVQVRNRRPVITELQLEPKGRVSRGERVTASAAGRDPDGDEIEFRYQWTVNGQPTYEEGPGIDTAALERGDRLQVTVYASDGAHQSVPVFSSVVEVENGNPEILSTPSGFGEDGVFRYQVEARDPEGDRSLRYVLRQAPQGMTLNPVLGELVWQPAASQAGNHTVILAVEDSQGAATLQSFELDVAIDAPPAAPAK